MRRTTKKRRLSSDKKLLLWLVLIPLIFFLTVFYYDKKMSPIIRSIGMSDAQDIATEAINNAIRATLADPDIDYSALTVIDKDSAGQVVSVKTDPAIVNALTTSLTLNVLNSLEKLNETTIGIPIGSLTDLEFISGIGPDINIKICPTQSVFTDIESDFKSVGINQTRHRILIKVTVSLDLVFPTEIITADCSETVVVAETIIVGNVPDFYRQQ